MREIGSTTCKKRLNYDQDGDIMIYILWWSVCLTVCLSVCNVFANFCPVVFYDYSWFQVGVHSFFMIPGWFFMFPDPFFMVTGWFFMASCWFYVSRWGFMVFHGSRFIFRGSRWVFPWLFIVQGGFFMVFHNSRLVFHGSRLVYMVFQCSSLIYLVPGWFISELSAVGAKWDVENIPKGTRLICILATRSHPLGLASCRPALSQWW